MDREPERGCAREQPTSGAGSVNYPTIKVGGKEVISEFICLTCSSSSHLTKRGKFLMAGAKLRVLPGTGCGSQMCSQPRGLRGKRGSPAATASPRLPLAAPRVPPPTVSSHSWGQLWVLVTSLGEAAGCTALYQSCS